MFRLRSALSNMSIWKLAAIVMLVAGAGTALASNGVAPVLVPYTITAIAGNNQSSVAGFGGDGVPGLSSTLSGPNALAVDSVGNVYIADQTNAIIRELNAQTGVIKIIAGVPPSSCTGTVCTTTNPGCSDGVPAIGNPVGSRMQGLVTDGFGNVYFSDYNYQGVWVIYHGGTRVANFITLVDGPTVTTAGGVKPGYIYHIAGLATPKAGGGCSATSGTTDKVLATAASFHDPLQMGIDAAGNLYVQDFANNVVRVINTQPTVQTFFGVSVQPGYVAAIVDCNSALTTVCPSTTPPFGGPVGTALYNTLAGMTTDQFGNVYELNTKGATGSIYGGVAYAGGSALAHLINLESGLTATPGSWYEVINSITSSNAPSSAVQAVLANGASDIVLRPSSIAVDPIGNLYMMDYHWISIYRIDVNSQVATRINGLSSAAGTNAAPAYCSGTTGPKTTDGYGDGCPISQAKFNSGGVGYVTFDGAGNLYVSDTGNNIVRKVSVGTQFPSTAIGSSVTQTLQVHFDASNLPTTTGTAPNLTTSGFKITSGAGDFSVSKVTCSNYTLNIDASLECYVNVAFTPTSSGARGASLQVTTANGSAYQFPLTGFGNGAQIAIDGGSPSAVPVSGVGKVAAVATDSAGNIYIADSANNQIIVSPAGGGTQHTVGTGFNNPQGVAVDAAGNVYVSDAGNSRIVKIQALTGAQTTLTTDTKNPHGLAVDTAGNVYVADTGNARVLEISPFGELGAAPLLAYSGAQTLSSPVAVAIDKKGNVFVADSGNSTGLIEILAGGGDLQTVPGGTTLSAPASVVSFGTAFVTAPAGVAVDGAGNLYVSDSTSNTVQELPASSGPGSEPFTLDLPGINSPTGLALDPAGNLYVADTGNNRVVFDNRSQVSVNFGTVAQFQPAATVPLTVTNIGSAPLSPAVPFVKFSGATADFSEQDSCGASNFPLGTLGSGLHCSLTPSFLPVANGSLSATASVQGGAAQLMLTGVGENPLVKMTMALTSPSTGPAIGLPATITLTATQPNGSHTPTGTVTFSYTINGVAQPSITQPLTANGSSSNTLLQLNNLLPARVYAISATYNGDTNNSITTASFTFTVPGYPLTAVANSVSYTYGGSVPTLTGTLTGILPADKAGITVTFTSAATQSSPVGNYPITVVLSGGNSQDYTIPTAVTPSGAPAVVTEKPAPLSVVLGSFNITYGSTDISYAKTMTVTGLVNGDSPNYSFTPPHSIVMPVGTYTIVPTLSILTKGSSYDRINNYNLNVTAGSLVVTQGPSALTIGQPITAVLPTALSTAAITITAAPPMSGFYGTPTGTVTVQDVFTPLTPTGAGTTVTEPNVVLPLTAGAATFTPNNSTLGTHVYTFSYSGDSNFLPASTSATPNTLIVDVSDFTVTSTSSPVQVAPGVTPGGNAAVAGEQAATPETATVYIAPILGSTATVNLKCAVPADYITCTVTPSTITLNGKTTMTSVVAISTPGTLPVNYTSKLRQSPAGVTFAVIPLAFLALLPFRPWRHRSLSLMLLLLVSAALLVSASGCGSGNSVKFFTPVPAGPQQVTITGASGSTSRSFTVPINIQ